MAVDDDATGTRDARREVSDQSRGDGGLARTRGAQQADASTRGYLERDAVDDAGASGVDAEILDDEHDELLSLEVGMTSTIVVT